MKYKRNKATIRNLHVRFLLLEKYSKKYCSCILPVVDLERVCWDCGKKVSNYTMDFFHELYNSKIVRVENERKI